MEGAVTFQYGRFFRPRPQGLIDYLSGLPGMKIPELNSRIEELYKPCCSHHPFVMTSDDELAKALLDMLEQVWEEKGIPEGTINASVTRLYAKKLWEGTEKGYGQKLSELEAGTPDHKMLTAIRENIWQFSGAKNYAQLRELSEALVTADGKLRTYKEFKEVALGINNKYVLQYLRTEYNFVITGGQACSLWTDIEATSDTLPLLEFDAVIDSQTTDLCRRLNGTRLPYNHPFWMIYFIPNHFGERSTVRKVASGRITPEAEIPSAEIPEMFRVNLAKERLLFPKGHPYFDRVPVGVVNDTNALMHGK